MKLVIMHEVKSRLSRLVKAVARLLPGAAPVPKRRFGALKGEIKLDDSFFDPLPETELDAWEGR